MPYITEDRRDEINNFDDLETPGELNYLITSAANRYIVRHGVSYATFNEVIGVLECAKIELYRRLVANYENSKIEENGDVYEETLIAAVQT